MSNFVKKNVIMDAEAMRRAIVRISHEIIERNKLHKTAQAFRCSL